jgi:hypothetical protein
VSSRIHLVVLLPRSDTEGSGGLKTMGCDDSFERGRCRYTIRYTHTLARCRFAHPASLPGSRKVPRKWAASWPGRQLLGRWMYSTNYLKQTYLKLCPVFKTLLLSNLEYLFWRTKEIKKHETL